MKPENKQILKGVIIGILAYVIIRKIVISNIELNQYILVKNGDC